MSFIASFHHRVREAAALFWAAAIALSVTPASAQGVRWGKDYVPNPVVTTQDGKQVRFYDDLIKNRIVVLSFIYTSCRDVCPLVTARLAQVQEKLGDIVGREFFFVSVSIDPENDTPAKLKQHADAFKVGAGWTFVTGKKADIDLIRYKLGERSQSLSEHRNEVMLGNDRTGLWARDSAFTDLNVLASTILAMDPARRDDPTIPQSKKTRAVHNDDVVPGQVLFAKACASCHTVGGGERVGPDLKGVTSRRDRAWLASFIIAPDEMKSRKDPVAMELSRKFTAVRMPTLGLSETDAADLIGFLELQNFRLTAPVDAATAAHAQQHLHRGGHEQHQHHPGHRHE
jgi:protein SCO1